MGIISICDDKELMLQMLEQNRIPAIRLAALKEGGFPVVGRSFGSHQGRDLQLIYDEGQAREGHYDFYTKLYVIEKEYILEVMGLKVQRTLLAVPNQIVQREIPIRTEAFGWSWREETVPEDWEELAIRAAYIAGVRAARVKLGKLTSGQPIVIDIMPMEAEEPKLALPDKDITIGADLEFMLSYKNQLIPASMFFEKDADVGCDGRQIERNSGNFALVEMRPAPSTEPEELYENIRKLLVKASDRVPYADIEFRAGSMPFSGYQCGGHLHFGMEMSLDAVRVLDHYLAVPVFLIEDIHKSRRRRRTKHGGLGRYRSKPYGFEYLGLGSWIIEPELTLGIICLAKLVVSHYEELALSSRFLFDPLMQRAFLSGNKRPFLAMWAELRQTLEKLSGYEQYSEPLNVLFRRIEEQEVWREDSDLRHEWGLPVKDTPYDPGHVILISRDLREKHHIALTDQTVFVRAGKSIASAKVQAYPFTFREAESVQLYDQLREVLHLPAGWRPNIAVKNGMLTVGPVMGIMASRPFGRQESYFAQLCKRGLAKRMLVYVFEPEDIDWGTLTVQGMYYEGKEFRKGTFPIPDIVYDRYFLHNPAQKKFVEQTRATLQEVYGASFINPPSIFELTGDKWRCHQLLSQHHAELLPETRLLKSVDDVNELLDLYGDVFLKPAGGALGKGVIRLLRQPESITWICPSEDEYKQVSQEELPDLLDGIMGRTKYIVQETIKRKQLNQKYVEVRVYVQKNSKQRWVNTGLVARISKEGIISRSREQVERISQVFPKLYKDERELEAIKRKLRESAHAIVGSLEEELGPCGEIAIDLCLDHMDQVKIIEINAKPDNLFSSIQAYRRRNTAINRLLNYATAMAGFHIPAH